MQDQVASLTMIFSLPRAWLVNLLSFELGITTDNEKELSQRFVPTPSGSSRPECYRLRLNGQALINRSVMV